VRREIGILLGIGVFLFLMLVPAGLSAPIRAVAAVTTLMVIWWISEAIPLEATALVPVVAFPLLGVLSPGEATAPYADRVIFLFLGGFLIAAAMERWNLHRRIALAIISRVGTRPRRLVLGVMVATAFISLWISNTATAMMMIPIALALAGAVPEGQAGEGPAAVEKSFGKCLVLSVAYGASIGGMGTLIGSPPNGIFAAQARTLFPGAPTVDFFSWLLFGLPFAAILLPLAWLWLTRGVFRDMPETIPLAGEGIRKEKEALGPLSRGERWTLLVFVLVALAWIFQETKQVGGILIPGIDSILPGISDASIAIGGALLLFLLPVDAGKGIWTLDWEHAVKIPWGILILFGGGLSLSVAFIKSGLAEALVRYFGILHALPQVLVVAIIATAICFLSEVTSNTAIASIMVPVMALTAVAGGIHPFLLMTTAAIASSMGFMLPVATPPNAIAFGTGYLSMREMVRSGFALNLIAIALWTVFSVTLVPWALGITTGLPGWAVAP
jgi:sodium-dependent dicarboxylate transporter 2/3/5